MDTNGKHVYYYLDKSVIHKNINMNCKESWSIPWLVYFFYVFCLFNGASRLPGGRSADLCSLPHLGPVLTHYKTPTFMADSISSRQCSLLFSPIQQLTLHAALMQTQILTILLSFVMTSESGCCNTSPLVLSLFLSFVREIYSYNEMHTLFMLFYYCLI